MIDRLFTAALTFCLLAGGTAAIGSAMMDYDQRAAALRNARPVMVLPTVTVIGKRDPAPAVARSESLEPSAKVIQ